MRPYVKVRNLVSSLVSSTAGRSPAPWMKEYESFDSALKDSDSYEDPRLIEVVSEKTKRFRGELGTRPRTISSRQVAQNLFVLSYVRPNEKISVLEVGGACGASYFEAAALLSQRIENWTILETPAMVAAARKIANDGRLSFHTDLESAVRSLQKRDLIVAQGVLQYARDPMGLLSNLFQLAFEYLYVTRTIVLVRPNNGNERPIFTKQVTHLSAHGPGPLPDNFADGTSSQPLTIVSLSKLATSIPPEYQLLYWFDETDDQSVSVGDCTATVRDVGFLARKLIT